MGSELLVDAPEASPGAAALPPMRKQESLVLGWTPSDRFEAQAFTRLTGQAGGEGFFDRADLERGVTFSLQPHTSTRAQVTGRLREGLESSDGTRAGNRLDGALSQKLGSLPLTATVEPGLENTKDGTALATTLASRQALIWNASADTILSVGTRLKDHQASKPGDSVQAMEAFTRWERTVSPDLALAAQTSVESRYFPERPAERDRQQFILQAGPTYRVSNDLTASLDFKSSFEHRDQRGLRDAEQAVSFSLNGKF
ncbi:MAG: hypothetical protein SNJ84_09385 [Verrucomicrobiia bacterium]